eukprot:363643-Chlamydomonas_euryale.AAC.9
MFGPQECACMPRYAHENNRCRAPASACARCGRWQRCPHAPPPPQPGQRGTDAGGPGSIKAPRNRSATVEKGNVLVRPQVHT